MILDLASCAVPAFLASLVLTLACERVARRAGIVARPRADRWHREPVPLMGGVAIVTASIGTMIAFRPAIHGFEVLAIGALAMALVGFVDDLRHLSPQTKLLAQVALAAAVLQFGYGLDITGSKLLNVGITLFWIIAITNAFNLLDNMDGLSATIALVAAAFRLLFFLWQDDLAGARVSAIFIGAVAGFLVRNFAPAKIFMGDAGSLFLGFFLAGLSVLGTEHAYYSRGTTAVLVIPVLLLLIPIFDTAFVTLTRLLAGTSPAIGGRDHTSHRLVAIGLTERQVVMLLALIATASGGVAVVSYRAGFSQAVVLLAVLVILLVLLAIHLSRVRVVDRVAPNHGGAVLRLLADFQYKRQVMTLLWDVCLIIFSYYAAYWIRFEQELPQYVEQFYGSLPVILMVQLASFAAFGLYRGVWRYTGLADALRIAKAATAGTMAAVVVLVFTTRFVGFSRSVFILDWLVLIVVLGATRMSFRFFSEVFRAKPESFRRVLIYGAGGGGELVVREILNNPELERVPIGFIDDDRNKYQTRIHGLPVLGDANRLEAVLRERDVSEVIVSSSKIHGTALDRVVEVCERLEIAVVRASLKLE